MLAYLIRHAESLSNVGEARGLNDGLTDLGREQSEALARRMKGVAVRALYSSPFRRALETALPLADACGRPVALRPELCEHHHLPAGSVADTELESVGEITRRDPRVIPCPDHAGSFEWVPADESFMRLVARVQSFAAFLKKQWPGADDAVVVVSHGSPIARLIEAWLVDEPGPSFRFIIDNAAVNGLRHHEGVSSLVCLNEVSHLANLPAPEAANYRDDGSIRHLPGSGYW
ncbi:MAG: histidine phosphatase family protein [Phycisphaerae bacterium]